MNDRFFHLRLSSTYADDKNTVDDLRVEVLNKDEWETLELSVRSPGFLLFINGLFSCQHLYMRTNSAERNIILESSEGEMKVIAGEFWNVSVVEISFKAKMKSGNPSDDDIAYIVERMKHCPVSSNLPEQVEMKNAVEFEH